MIAALANLDTVALQQAASACFTIAGWLSALLVLGTVGYFALGGTGPYPQGGVWRRDTRGRAVCPLCAEVPAPEDASPLLPPGEGAPVEAREKCCSCMAYRAEDPESDQ